MDVIIFTDISMEFHFYGNHVYCLTVSGELVDGAGSTAAISSAGSAADNVAARFCDVIISHQIIIIILRIYNILQYIV